MNEESAEEEWKENAADEKNGALSDSKKKGVIMGPMTMEMVPLVWHTAPKIDESTVVSNNASASNVPYHGSQAANKQKLVNDGNVKKKTRKE
ncbi:hypothetical protein F2Q69_00047106 [Brassica cretica]|uniref:Uncharacterized protein n=1 Tax=Brassica cretica TaxID=69181 RepID=A0A8S9PFD3_BRACR|nr:hypothetical protein F2Q69_00047106 [Brassica cretica]